MPNPFLALKNTKCDNCDEYIDEGDDVYIHDGEKFCGDCAQSAGWICDCGNFKKPDFNKCYECSRA